LLSKDLHALSVNGLSQTVTEQYASNNSWKKVKPADFEEVGGPFGRSACAL
jgi:hypothetical protein